MDENTVTELLQILGDVKKTTITLENKINYFEKKTKELEDENKNMHEKLEAMIIITENVTKIAMGQNKDVWESKYGESDSESEDITNEIENKKRHSNNNDKSIFKELEYDTDSTIEYDNINDDNNNKNNETQYNNIQKKKKKKNKKTKNKTINSIDFYENIYLFSFLGVVLLLFIGMIIKSLMNKV